ncbi:hypothetical protein RCL_jg20484.t1 [Rhizophagus clarus]|uniref:Uncharacterized protein n=1 Tax=Rhizophagus clarus TaxID=94130 RepID=A0A8H3LED3_9GLOM|nr:hypothetical protein RCL_jg20484.t1 [Rhizophagus clarus]
MELFYKYFSIIKNEKKHYFFFNYLLAKHITNVLFYHIIWMFLGLGNTWNSASWIPDMEIAFNCDLLNTRRMNRTWTLASWILGFSRNINIVRHGLQPSFDTRFQWEWQISASLMLSFGRNVNIVVE